MERRSFARLLQHTWHQQHTLSMTFKMQTATCEGYETPTMKAKAYILYIFVYFVGIMSAMGFKLLFIQSHLHERQDKRLDLMIPLP